MKNLTLLRSVVVCLILLSMPWSSFAESTKNIERTGDILQLAIPLTAYGMTYIFDDRGGQRSLTSSLFSTLGTTYALKYTFQDERPDGGEGSFVSGHTSSAFSAAAFIQRRYGWKYGLPAYLAASFVGWSRVKAGRHYSDDVLRGAAIGILSSYLLTRPYHKNVRVSPMVNGHTLGLNFQFLW